MSCLFFFPFLDSGLNYFSIFNLWIIFHLFTRFNSSMQKFFMGKSANVANGNAAASSEMEDGNANYDYVWDDDPSSPLLSAGKVNQTGWVLKTTLYQKIKSILYAVIRNRFLGYGMEIDDGLSGRLWVFPSVALNFAPLCF